VSLAVLIQASLARMTAEIMEQVIGNKEPEQGEDDLVEMDVDQGGQEEASTATSGVNPTDPAAAVVPAVSEAAVEREVDDPVEASGKCADEEVTIYAADTTLDTFFDAERGVLSSLSDGGFQHLLSGARASTGATAGRYLFEVQLLGSVEKAKTVLRVGFSTAGSSLFLGDKHGHGVAFDSGGAFLAAGQKKKVCGKIGKKVVGILLNLNKDGPNAGTVSLFLDGERAGQPQAIPPELLGKAFFPTITFMNVTLAVNFGRSKRQLRALPFKCTMFANILKANCEQSTLRPSKDGSFQVVVPVGLPEQGVFDFVDSFRAERPQFEELSDRRLLEWCKESGIEVQEALSCSRDRVDFASAPAGLNGESLQPMLKTLALLARRDVIFCEVCSGLLKAQRTELLRNLPQNTRRSAIVVVGEPSAAFKAFKEKVPTREADNIPDVSEKALGCYSQFSMPTEAEGFEKVNYEWLGKDAAEAHLKAWILERKATTIIEDLEPGEWFKEKVKEWHALRAVLRQRHVEYAKKKKETPQLLDTASSFDIKGMTIDDIHNIDSKGTPIYANFKFEDWLLLQWRLDLHFLAHAFAMDVGDADRPGIPEEQLAHYYQIYTKVKCDPSKLACDNLQKVLRLLKLPGLELADKGGKSKILCSGLDKDTSLKDFIIGVESYRRDRNRRIDAGDESAQLRFPKTQPPKAGAPPAKGPGPKPAPGKGIQKGNPPSVKAVSKAPSPGAAAAAGASAVKRVVPPAAAGPGGLKRPTAPSAPPPGFVKKPRLEGEAAGDIPTGKAPIAKAPISKAPISKAPVSKAPVGKAPVAKAPIAKVPPVRPA